MKIFPAIDLFEDKAVRLYKGDYSKITVYSENPAEIAQDFEKSGASHIHIVDLEGAISGSCPNIETIKKIKNATSLFTEVGGGIRSMEVIKTYLDAGIDRVILGTAAVTDKEFLTKAVSTYGDKIAVGADIKNGKVAIHGWTNTTDTDIDTFCTELQILGVKTVICTDISKDGAMKGTNRKLYKELSEKYSFDIIASGGVSSMDDVISLANMNLYGAIIGKAYYTGAINIKEAVEVAEK